MFLVAVGPRQQQLQEAELQRLAGSVLAVVCYEVNSMAVGLLAGAINDNQPAGISGVAQAAGA